jgi:Rieske Fe-S protein
MRSKMSETTRRNVLAGAVGVGAAAVLAACGGNDASGTGSATGSGNDGGGQASAAAGEQAAGAALASASEIPVGGGKIFKDKDVVVTQPTAGQFKAFSATCTHQGCPVNSVANGTINCPCHGSKFSVADGSVKGGPAPKGLAPKNVAVQDGQITLA